MTLFGNPCRCKWLRWGHTGVGWVPIPTWVVSSWKGQFEDIHTEKKQPCKPEGRDQAKGIKDGQQTPEASTEAWTGSLFRPSEGPSSGVSSSEGGTGAACSCLLLCNNNVTAIRGQRACGSFGTQVRDCEAPAEPKSTEGCFEKADSTCQPPSQCRPPPRSPHGPGCRPFRLCSYHQPIHPGTW